MPSPQPDPKKETPKKHVENSVGRQEKLAKQTAATARQLAKKADDRAAILAKATDLLSSRVGALADAVQINNERIATLQKEVNCKPDDAEVKLITGMAQAERKQQLKVAIWTAVASSVMAATIGAIIAFNVAEQKSYEGCKVNDRNIAIIVSLLESRVAENSSLQPTIDALKANRNDCR